MGKEGTQKGKKERKKEKWRENGNLAPRAQGK